MSGLPIHQDGSCNGLQHYAALGLTSIVDDFQPIEYTVFEGRLTAEDYGRWIIRLYDDELLLPGSSRYLHLYEARFLRMIIDVSLACLDVQFEYRNKYSSCYLLREL